ncbi:hypothetical protein EWM64_g1168 [Hericium alpestre]|uniref:Protein YAE1 n=1 Tax=Hericium alpestre TaxID=135208 RepID=A0A4Z0A701_9AGAM|nr:hypothetical protein EWM64_g1168 [Hericium alpestre]
MAYHLDIVDPVISSESPWEDDTTAVPQAHEAEWAKLSSDFTNSGYREGITAGKEEALQEGFDAGFAEVGVPLGQELGLLRGLASALQSFLASMPPTPELEAQLAETREIAEKLAEVRFSDIAPRDLEAEQHAREHLQDGAEELDENDELAEKRRVEQLEDMMNQLTAGAGGSQGGKSRPTVEDVQMLKARLEGLIWDSAEVDITFEKPTGLAAQLQKYEDSAADSLEFERLKEHFEPFLRASSSTLPPATAHSHHHTQLPDMGKNKHAAKAAWRAAARAAPPLHPLVTTVTLVDTPSASAMRESPMTTQQPHVSHEADATRVSRAAAPAQPTIDASLVLEPASTDVQPTTPVAIAMPQTHEHCTSNSCPEPHEPPPALTTPISMSNDVPAASLQQLHVSQHPDMLIALHTPLPTLSASATTAVAVLAAAINVLGPPTVILAYPTQLLCRAKDFSHEFDVLVPRTRPATSIEEIDEKSSQISSRMPRTKHK